MGLRNVLPCPLVVSVDVEGPFTVERVLPSVVQDSQRLKGLVGTFGAFLGGIYGRYPEGFAPIGYISRRALLFV